MFLNCRLPLASLQHQCFAYDKESGRGNFTLYDIELDEEGCYIRMGMKYYRLSEDYALFALYGGIEGVRQIIRDEVMMLSDKDMAFVCAAFNLKKEELKCYTRKQSKQALMNS